LPVFSSLAPCWHFGRLLPHLLDGGKAARLANPAFSALSLQFAAPGDR
jgi:hypothetical protein